MIPVKGLDTSPVPRPSRIRRCCKTSARSSTAVWRASSLSGVEKEALRGTPSQMRVSEFEFPDVSVSPAPTSSTRPIGAPGTGALVRGKIHSTGGQRLAQLPHCEPLGLTSHFYTRQLRRFPSHRGRETLTFCFLRRHSVQTLRRRRRGGLGTDIVQGLYVVVGTKRSARAVLTVLLSSLYI